jgi:hypothetical protein
MSLGSGTRLGPYEINTLPEQTTSSPITVVLNWTEELKK